MPRLQPATPLMIPGQALPQAPQFILSALVSMHLESQHSGAAPASVLGQSAAALHESAHTKVSVSCTHFFGIAQLSFVGRQGTQLPLFLSQRGVAPPHDESEVHGQGPSHVMARSCPPPPPTKKPPL